VVIPVMTQHYAMLQRNLLYTGVTRGKRLVVLVAGDPRSSFSRGDSQLRSAPRCSRDPPARRATSRRRSGLTPQPLGKLRHQYAPE
jgi:ATP-dependent exoDNAse (exonuclease V) alpha subunit